VRLAAQSDLIEGIAPYFSVVARESGRSSNRKPFISLPDAPLSRSRTIAFDNTDYEYYSPFEVLLEQIP
jgi:hypothetical protein